MFFSLSLSVLISVTRLRYIFLFIFNLATVVCSNGTGGGDEVTQKYTYKMYMYDVYEKGFK